MVRLSYIETSDRSERLNTQQKQQSITQVLDNIRNNAEIVMANRLATNQRPDHHDGNEAREGDFTEDEEDADLVRRRATPIRRTVYRRRQVTDYYSASRGRSHRNPNTTDSRRDHKDDSFSNIIKTIKNTSRDVWKSRLFTRKFSSSTRGRSGRRTSGLNQSSQQIGSSTSLCRTGRTS